MALTCLKRTVLQLAQQPLLRASRTGDVCSHAHVTISADAESHATLRPCGQA